MIRDKIETIINKFDGLEKEILTLRYLQLKTQSEVGELLGIHKKFISSIENNAINKIR